MSSIPLNLDLSFSTISTLPQLVYLLSSLFLEFFKCPNWSHTSLHISHSLCSSHQVFSFSKVLWNVFALPTPFLWLNHPLFPQQIRWKHPLSNTGDIHSASWQLLCSVAPSQDQFYKSLLLPPTRFTDFLEVFELSNILFYFNMFFIQRFTKKGSDIFSPSHCDVFVPIHLYSLTQTAFHCYLFKEY